MTMCNTRETRIRLCSLRIRYRKAWLSQADSKTLAALLTAIESLTRSLSGPGIEQESRMSADNNRHERGTVNAQRIQEANK